MLVHTLTTVNEHILKYLNGYDLAGLSCTETECKKCVYAYDTYWKTHEDAERTKHSWREQFYTICHASRVFSGRMYPNFCIQHAHVVHTATHKQLLFIVVGNGMIYVYDERAKSSR